MCAAAGLHAQVRPAPTAPTWRTCLAHEAMLTGSEFFGSLMILLFGAGVECQVRLHYDYAGHKQSYGACKSSRGSHSLP